jgi:hypothetical protein
MGDPEFSVSIATCSVTQLRRVKANSGHKWVCVRGGDTTHLSKGAQWGWEFPEDLKKRNKT